MKIANVRLKWTRSPSTDLMRRKLVVTVDGDTTEVDLGLEVNEYVLDIHAKRSVMFKTIVTDTERKEVESAVYSFTLGDLEDPLPDTELVHEILSVRDTEE